MRQSEIDQIQTSWLLKMAAANCLHVGCGEKPIEWALNIDPNPDRKKWIDEPWDIHDTPGTTGVYHSIVSSHVIPSLKQPVIAFLEMARLLVPGDGIMAHIIPDWRYAPQRHDPRFRFQWQHNGWYGPRKFSVWFHENFTLLYPGLFEEISIASFKEFDFSFKFTARRAEKTFGYDLSTIRRKAGPR